MKKYLGLAIMIAALAVPMAFNSCSATHNEGGSASFASNGACVAMIQPGAQPVYNYVRNSLQCATCHFKGSTAAPSLYYFADPNPADAMDGFANMAKDSPTKFYDKVFTPHFGGAGDTPENRAALDPLRGAFVSAGEAFNACMQQQNVGGGGGGQVDLNPTKQTIAKNIPANPTNPTNITWNLGTEMATPGAAIPGAQFRITIQAVNSSTGVPQYYITAPNAQGGTAGAIQIRNIRVYFNGALLSISAGGGTWTSLNNLAPSGRLHQLASGTGVMIIPADTSVATNTIAIGFGQIEISTQYPDFNPTTFARLTSTQNVPAAERVFSQKCAGCHGNSGGLSLANNQLANLKGPRPGGLPPRVIPFVPEASLIYQRITLPENDPQRMPQAPNAALTPEEIRWVRDWILDGAR